MKIALTGTTSGIGKELHRVLSKDHDIISIDRKMLDLSNMKSVLKFNLPKVDMLINVAGTDTGGKIEFTQHLSNEVLEILNTNLLAPVLLSQKALQKNVDCKIVNITSTNNKRYYPNNLTYSLSKKSLETFSNMLQVEYPTAHLLEIRLGLTKTNFNKNRYKNHTERYQDIYEMKHLDVTIVAEKIHKVLFDDDIKLIEISP